MPYFGDYITSAGSTLCYTRYGASDTTSAASSTVTYYWPSIEPDNSEQRAAKQKEREAAVHQAEMFLKECLGEERYSEYKGKGHITVDSPMTPGRHYVVDGHNRIKVYDGDRLVDELCVQLVEPDSLNHDSYWLPEPDVVLGKVLLIENDEERVLKVANHNPR